MRTGGSGEGPGGGASMRTGGSGTGPAGGRVVRVAAGPTDACIGMYRCKK